MGEHLAVQTVVADGEDGSANSASPPAAALGSFGPFGGLLPPPQFPPFPPIPRPFPPFPTIRLLRGGCWLTNYEPIGSSSIAYDGTIRIEHNQSGTTASGDLYQRPFFQIPSLPPRVVLLPPPSPTNGIPNQARSRYRYFLRVTNIPESLIVGNSFRLDFEMWRFNAGGINHWAATPESSLTALMTWTTAPAGYPGTYLEGDVKGPVGNITGRLKMGWISDSYRKVVVEIDTVAGPPPERPLDNGAGETWVTVFGAVGFDMSLHLSDTDVSKLGDDSWSDAEMHSAMLARRETVNLDTEWHYHILAVKRIESTERGIMYDADVTDSDNIPREGLGIASEWVPPTGSIWGDTAGHTWGSNKAAYFRTAVHELGHALGLEHNLVDTGYMCTSDVIASRPGGPFPRQIKWAFNDDDLKRLRHWPDVFVRPGGVEFGGAMSSGLPMTPTDLDLHLQELKLKVVPVLPEVPVGAPVRLELKLTNCSASAMQVPTNVSLRSPFLSCTVAASFMPPCNVLPMVQCTDSDLLSKLQPGETRSGSVTLLRGADGPLFPTSGLYTITVRLLWPSDNNEFFYHASGSNTVFITPASDAQHASAAHKVLATPDVQVLLMAGDDSKRLAKGIEAVQAALDDSTLKPHFAVIEAKRLAKHYKRRNGDLNSAGNVLRGVNAIMSDSERATLQNHGL